MKFLFILACALTTACSAADAGWKMFDRRVGMFVHWGVYASLGYHEQARMRLFIPRDEYTKKALPDFTADKFCGDDLVDAAESLGAEYIVVTTKHHDGFCLWDTKATDFNAVNSPAKRDLIKELADACHRRGMKLGFYYSNPDWHHPNAYNKRSSHQTPPEAGDVPDMEKYKAFVRQQITELLSNYGEICCLFWDIPTRIEAPEMNELVRRLQPGIRINDRGWGSSGDYSTPERDLPAGKAFRRPTEACDSVGARSWGYRANEDYRTVGYCTRSIDHFLSLGGNFLLNVGPKADGTVPSEALSLLKRTGDWYRRVREAFRDVTTVETDVKADDPTVMTRRGNTVYVHCPKGLNQTGLDLRAIRILPEKAVVLNDGAPVSCDLDVIPHNYEARQKTLHLGNLAADRYANEAVVIRLDFAEDPLAAGCARTVELKPGTTEVVVAPDAPSTVRFAADEMTNLLAKTFGRAVPLVTAPTAGRQGVYLGANDWTRRAGIDVAGLKRDGFTIVAKDGNVYIAGRDDEKVDFYHSINSLRTGVWDLLNEHATLFGAYEFLERFARVRLYFPGELGTIVPRLNAVKVPEGSLTLAPDYTTRKYSWYPDGVYFEGTNRTAQLLPERKLNYVRNRMETIYIPCCHGSNGFRVQSRFAKEHPEYMLLFKKGGKLVRDLDPKEKSHHPGQICHSSAVYDEFFKDICSYARGEGPEVRGMGSWRPGVKKQDWAIMTFRSPWVDIMPQDGMQACQCEKCQAAYNKKEFHYATELIWGRTVELANRLKQAGVDIRLTQMAYTPYRRIPEIDIPDNVDVMVAEGGPWSVRRPETLAKEYEEISGWAKKLKRPVWIWTYPGKYGQMDLPNVPDGTPRAWGKYYKETAKWSFGAFAESGGDRAFYNYLCYYVFGKVCWDNQTDVDALLDEYFRLMFGPAAKEMAALVDDVERLWLDEVAGKSIETDLGPQRVAPSPYDLYVNIYSDKTMAHWDAWLKAAAAKVADGSLEARRIALYRQEYYDPLMKARTAYCDAISVEKEVANRAAHPERRNLLVNGDFSETMKCNSNRHFGIWQKGKGPSWQGGWIAGNEDGPQISFHDDVPKGVKGQAMKIVGNGKVIGVGNHFTQRNGRLKPGQRYRVSYFVRLTDVVPQKPKSGVCMRVWCDHNTFFPHNHMTGTTGWIHQSFEFVAGPKSQEFENSYQVYLWNSTGTVEYADLRLEEH